LEPRDARTTPSRPPRPRSTCGRLGRAWSVAASAEHGPWPARSCRRPRRRGSVPFGLVDDLEDLAAEELLDDLAAVAGGDHRVLVVASRPAGGVGVRGGGRGTAAAQASGALPGTAGGLRRLAHQRRAAARGRRCGRGTGP